MGGDQLLSDDLVSEEFTFDRAQLEVAPTGWGLSGVGASGRLDGYCRSCTIQARMGNGRVLVNGGGQVGVCHTTGCRGYMGQHLVKALPGIQVDIYEKLPVPYGLVRFGVAPDHPEVKNCISTFNKTVTNPSVTYCGNVCLGRDVSLSSLRANYNSVLLTYGADEDRTLGIPGENLEN